MTQKERRLLFKVLHHLDALQRKDEPETKKQERIDESIKLLDEINIRYV